MDFLNLTPVLSEIGCANLNMAIFRSSEYGCANLNSTIFGCRRVVAIAFILPTHSFAWPARWRLVSPISWISKEMRLSESAVLRGGSFGHVFGGRVVLWSGPGFGLGSSRALLGRSDLSFGCGGHGFTGRSSSKQYGLTRRTSLNWCPSSRGRANFLPLQVESLFELVDYGMDVIRACLRFFMFFVVIVVIVIVVVAIVTDLVSSTFTGIPPARRRSVPR